MFSCFDDYISRDDKSIIMIGAGVPTFLYRACLQNSITGEF